MNVLVLSPHPDDETLGCGGTILHHRAAGDEVRVVFLTSGEAGGHGAEPEETARIREAEARAAMAVLDVGGVEFWHEPDGHLRARQAVVDRLVTRLSEDRTDRVYVTHPTESHPDHRAAGRIAVRAARAAPHDVSVLGFEIWTPLPDMDVIVDITAHVDAKFEAVACYASQNAVVGFEAAFRGLARYRGEMHSWPGGAYAEVFAAVPVRPRSRIGVHAS